MSFINNMINKLTLEQVNSLTLFQRRYRFMKSEIETINEQLTFYQDSLMSMLSNLVVCNKINIYTGTNTSFMNILEELKETLSCSICLDSYSQKNNIWTTGCGHLYHKRCINQCINAGHRKCPLCKKPINKAKLHPIWI